MYLICNNKILSRSHLVFLVYPSFSWKKNNRTDMSILLLCNLCWESYPDYPIFWLVLLWVYSCLISWLEYAYFEILIVDWLEYVYFKILIDRAELIEWWELGEYLCFIKHRIRFYLFLQLFVSNSEPYLALFLLNLQW